MKFNGEKIKELRTQRNMSLFQVSVLMGSVCTPAVINKWERGQSTPTSNMLGVMAHAFGVGVDYFFDHDYQQRVNGGP